MRCKPFILALAVLAVSVPATAQEITVAAASDLQFALREIAAGFEKQTGYKAKLVFGSSGNLFGQIRQGAPFDVFFSADVHYAGELESAGLVEPGSVEVYAVGRIVVWVPRDSRIDVEQQQLRALLDPAVKRIAIANPRHAPYGRAAVAALERFGIFEQVKDKLVLGENISQAAQFVESGNAQVGILALSLALAPTMKERGEYWEIPADAYPLLEQGVVILKASQQQEAAHAFLAHVTSTHGREVLRSYGFVLPGEGVRPASPAAGATNWNAFALTIRLAMGVSVILLFVGLPVAYWVAYSRWRWKFLVESVVALPLVLPPTVLGFYILVATGPHSALGRWYQGLVGHPLAFTFEGLLVASVLYSLPFAVQPFAAAFAAVDARLLEASAVLGSTRLRTFARVILPLSVRGVVTGFVLSFAHTLGEFGVVLMVGGNIPGVTRTASIDIYDHVQALDYAAANQMALALLAFSFVTLAVVYGLNRKVWSAWLAR